MNDLLNLPVIWFVVSFCVLWLVAVIAARLHGGRDLEEAESDDLKRVLGASVTLLALIIGFSFSMAAGRYDQRKLYEEEEANAIGTEYVRVELMPSQQASQAQSLLRQYLAERIQWYTARGDGEVADIDARTAAMQQTMWALVRGYTIGKPGPIGSLIASGMNDVLNSQGYTAAAWSNRIPTDAWALMGGVAIFCSALLGYMGRRSGGARRTWLLPLIIAVPLFLLADLDSPRNGFIHVHPNNLLSLEQTLR